MKPSTVALHRALIRSIKGMIAAWEKWLKEQEDTE